MLNLRVFEYDDHFIISWSTGKECGMNYVSKDEVEHPNNINDEYQKLLKLLRKEVKSDD